MEVGTVRFLKEFQGPELLIAFSINHYEIFVEFIADEKQFLYFVTLYKPSAGGHKPKVKD